MVEIGRKDVGAAARCALRYATCAVLVAFLMLVYLVAPAYADDDAGVSASSASASASAVSANDVADSDDDAGDADDDDGNLIDPAQRADNSFIYDTTIESLFDQASLYEGRTVQVVGEVVGDLIRADGGRDRYWIMLTSIDSDNKSSISVLISAEQAKQIDHFGRYGVTGTTLQVRGTYHQACADHQGIPDIHASTSSPIARGVEDPDTFELSDFAPGALAVIAGLALMGAYYFARERSR